MNSRAYVVEDDAGLRSSLQKYLCTLGYDTICFESAHLFLKSVEAYEESLRCLILDFRLPDLNGLDVLRELRASGINIATVMISGEADVSNAVTALKQGVIDFLEKPVPPQSLKAALEKAIDEDRVRRDESKLRDYFRSCMKSLSPRETDVFELVLGGKNSKQMSSILGIGVATVLKHKASMLAKFESRNEVELARKYMSYLGGGSRSVSRLMD